MEQNNKTQLYTMLCRLSRQMHRFSHRAEHKQGLYHGQYRLLKIISNNDGIIQRDLAEQMDMRPSSITEALTRMEQLNVITRKQDEKDQRLMHIHITQLGKKKIVETIRSEENYTDALFKGISEDEIQGMLAITTKLCNSIDILNSEDPDDCAKNCNEQHCKNRKKHHNCD